MNHALVGLFISVVIRRMTLNFFPECQFIGANICHKIFLFGETNITPRIMQNVQLSHGVNFWSFTASKQAEENLRNFQNVVIQSS